MDKLTKPRVEALAAVESELIRALGKHGMPVDYHHGLGILAEEAFELFSEIRRRDEWHNPHRIAAEAVQVAAVACKIVMLAKIRAKEMVAR